MSKVRVTDSHKLINLFIIMVLILNKVKRRGETTTKGFNNAGRIISMRKARADNNHKFYYIEYKNATKHD